MGPDPATVADYAERVIDLNLGRHMADGERFTNAAYIDVGWEIELPTTDAVTVSEGPTSPGSHVVSRGETLWSIAEDELGEASRWPELYDANVATVFDDGRHLVDPDVILPGWELSIPAADDLAVTDTDTDTRHRHRHRHRIDFGTR